MSALLDELRSLPTMIHSFHQEKPYLFSLFPQGIPKSGLVEVIGGMGSGKTEALLQFFAENLALKVAWIETPFTLYPKVFLDYGLSFNRFLFIDLSTSPLKNPALWCASQILRSQLFQVVVLVQLKWSQVDLRRLQLLAKQSGSLIIFLNTDRIQEQTWMFSLQLEVGPRKEAKKVWQCDEASRCQDASFASPVELKLLKGKNLPSWSTVKA